MSFCMPPFVLPTFNFSPAQGLASIEFSFLRSAREPMLSQPFVLLPEFGRDDSSLSEKMAIFELLPFLGAVDLACCCCATEGDDVANGSIFDANAARTVGSAGLVGSAAF